MNRRLRWLLLAFAPSSLMLALRTTSRTDIASVPLLWIIPLALYLLTMVSRSRASRCSRRVLAMWSCPVRRSSC
jgi:hypothetical protein